ncbi:MAG: DUF2029 domain-containing protein [Clostridia bacterium]|nr:DUF2029 domain-containing protein [Clostridia bacterium]
MNIAQKFRDLRTREYKVYYKSFFYIAMACFILVFLILGKMTGGASFKSVFFKDRGDSFMDHYNSVIYNAVDPYENYVMYPPLATITYKLFLTIIPENVYNYVVSDPTKTAQPQQLKYYQGFVFQFIIFSMIMITAFLITVFLCKKGRAREKLMFAAVSFLSTPFLFMLERGNNIIISLIFSLLFVSFYDSEKKVLRELALIFLAIAVAYKLYPIALGVLLFRNKQYKELFRAGVYCVIFTVLPFFIFYDGINSIKLMLGSISRVGGRTATAANINGQLNFNQLFYYITGVLRISLPGADTLATLCRFALTGACVFCAFFIKDNWKSAMMCAAIIYGFQGTCSTYLLIFFLIPVMMLLDSEKKNNLLTYVYLFLMIMSIAPIVMPDPNTVGWSRYMPTKISSLAVLGMVGLACLETLVYIIPKIRKLFADRKAAKACKKALPQGGAA